MVTIPIKNFPSKQFVTSSQPVFSTSAEPLVTQTATAECFFSAFVDLDLDYFHALKLLLMEVFLKPPQAELGCLKVLPPPQSTLAPIWPQTKRVVCFIAELCYQMSTKSKRAIFSKLISPHIVPEEELNSAYLIECPVVFCFTSISLFYLYLLRKQS